MVSQWKSVKEIPAPSKLGSSRLSLFYGVKGSDSAKYPFPAHWPREQELGMFNGEIHGVAISPKSNFLATRIPKENGVRWQLFFHWDVAASVLGFPLIRRQM